MSDSDIFLCHQTDKMSMRIENVQFQHSCKNMGPEIVVRN